MAGIHESDIFGNASLFEEFADSAPSEQQIESYDAGSDDPEDVVKQLKEEIDALKQENILLKRERLCCPISGHFPSLGAFNQLLHGATGTGLARSCLVLAVTPFLWHTWVSHQKPCFGSNGIKLGWHVNLCCLHQ